MVGTCLVIRRDIADPHEKRYYFVFAPPGTSLAEMVKAIGARWHIEEDFENGKDMGLDHYEVRSAPLLVPARDTGEAFGSLSGRDLCAGSHVLPGRCALDAGFASPNRS